MSNFGSSFTLLGLFLQIHPINSSNSARTLLANSSNAQTFLGNSFNLILSISYSHHHHMYHQNCDQNQPNHHDQKEFFFRYLAICRPLSPLARSTTGAKDEEVEGQKRHQKCMQHRRYHKLSTSLLFSQWSTCGLQVVYLCSTSGLVVSQTATDHHRCFCICMLKCSEVKWMGWGGMGWDGSLKAPLL